MKKTIIIFLVILSYYNLTFSGKLVKPDQSPTLLDQAVSKAVVSFLERYHLEHKEFNDSISALLFKDYFKTLDPGKYFFYQKDIDNLSGYKYRIDDQIDEGILSFAYDVHELFKLRVEERIDYVKKRINDDFDFSKNEFLDSDRDSVEWVSNVQEMNELWRKRVKNNYLLYLIIEEALKEKEAKGELTEDEKKLKEEQKLFVRKTPKERLLQSYERMLTGLEELNSQEVLERFLSTLTRIYDPHSSYMAASTLEDFNISMSLKLQGIGASLTTQDGLIKISRIIPGGPAHKDGRLKSGDRIIAVRSETNPETVDLIDLPIRKAIRYIRGEKGTKVFLTIIDGSKGLGSKPVEIDLIRDEVKIEDSAAEGKIFEFTKNSKKYNLGIISIPSFYADFEGLRDGENSARILTDDVKKILNDFNKTTVDGIIIDLRSNGGGSLTEVVKTTGLFIKEGPVVQVKGFGSPKVLNDEDSSIDYAGPLLVMVNGLSASASEIFAGAIQDYGRGIIVGDKQTHGKGTVQTMLDLKRIFKPDFVKDKDPGSLKYTIQKFYRITGASTQNKGVVPDIIFPSYLDEMKIHEYDLEHAMKWDEIEGTDFIRVDNLGKILPKLKEKSTKRMASNENYKNLLEDINKFTEELNNKKISLNKEERSTEREESQNSGDLRRVTINGTNSSALEDNETILNKTDFPGDEKDIYLKECMNILTDYIELKTAGK